MKTLKKYAASLLAFFWILLGIPALAQNPAEIEMADQLRADGKIYVVVAVVAVILIGIFINMAFVYFVLKKTEWLGRLLGKAGLEILRKAFGLILLAIAVKLFRSNTGL